MRGAMRDDRIIKEGKHGNHVIIARSNGYLRRV